MNARELLEKVMNESSWHIKNELYVEIRDYLAQPETKPEPLSDDDLARIRLKSNITDISLCDFIRVAKAIGTDND
jgi:hypothetical protein